MAQATIRLNGTVSTFPLNPKVFQTGNKGYHGSGMMQNQEGKRYRVNIRVVRIEVKSKSE